MKVWRAAFAAAAVFNLAVGGFLLTAPGRAAAAMGVASAPFNIQFGGLMIAAFGIGYAMVARDPDGNRGIVWIGLIGKVGAIALAAAYYLRGAFPAEALSLPAGDAAFALVFLAFLWRGRR